MFTSFSTITETSAAVIGTCAAGVRASHVDAMVGAVVAGMAIGNGNGNDTVETVAIETETSVRGLRGVKV